MLLAERGAGRPARRRKVAAAGLKPGRFDQRRAAAEQRQALAPYKRKVEQLEGQMGALQTKIARLDEKLADPDFYTSDPEAAKAAGIDRGRLAQQLAEAEDRWLSASETLEKQRFAAGAEDEETATR